MNQMITPRRQRGVTLVVGLIMLVLITLMVTTAFMMSTTNLKAVGNMQFRDEAIAAANVAVERVVSADFTLAPAASSHNVDLDDDGSTDYTVDVDAPVCIKAIGILKLSESDPDSVNCTIGSLGGTPVCYETVWEITATVRSSGYAAALTGAQATVRQGISKRMNVTNLKKLCK